MNEFRMIDTDFWGDSLVGEEMTPEDKLFFLYLLTNSHTTSIGIYQITKRRMAFDLGYSIETVDELMHRFIHHFDLVRYNTDTWELAIKDWGRYNLEGPEVPKMKCLAAELVKVKERSLITYVGENIHNESIKSLFLEAASSDVDEFAKKVASRNRRSRKKKLRKRRRKK